MLADQPLLARDKLAAMLDLFDGRRMVCASYQGREGVPAVFPRALFAKLMALEGDAGAKVLLQSVQDKVTVAMPEAAVDIDTLEDLKQLPPF
jgi:molybdenum cofactor cytidylyltransferase